MNNLRLVNLLIKKHLKIASAESLTGGLFASSLIAIPGSSEIIDACIVTYSNESKIKFCNVNPKTLNTFGAVSEQVASEMAIGISNTCGSNIGVSFSGIAGPTGATKTKPVGMVCMAIHLNGSTLSFTEYFDGDRTNVREQSVNFMINKLIDLLEK